MSDRERLSADFLQTLKYVLQHSPATLEAYQRDLEKYFEFCQNQNLNILEVSSQDIITFVSTLGEQYSQSTISRILSCLHQFYKWLVLQRYLSVDPTLFVSVVKKPSEITNYLTHEEFLKLIDFPLEKPVDYLDRTLLELLYGSGLRVSEALSLQFKHLHHRERLLNIIGKGQKQRLVPFSQNFYEVYEQYLMTYRQLYVKNRSEFIFINRKSMPLSRQSVYNMVSKRALDAGFTKKVSPHVLRHSFASSLISAGANLRVIQELLGHQDISTTQIYTHLKMDEKRAMYDQYHPLSKRKKEEK